jgi:hypothetical protein
VGDSRQMRTGAGWSMLTSAYSEVAAAPTAGAADGQQSPAVGIKYGCLRSVTDPWRAQALTTTLTCSLPMILPGSNPPTYMPSGPRWI